MGKNIAFIAAFLMVVDRLPNLMTQKDDRSRIQDGSKCL